MNSKTAPLSIGDMFEYSNSDEPDPTYLIMFTAIVTAFDNNYVQYFFIKSNNVSDESNSIIGKYNWAQMDQFFISRIKVIA